MKVGLLVGGDDGDSDTTGRKHHGGRFGAHWFRFNQHSYIFVQPAHSLHQYLRVTPSPSSVGLVFLWAKSALLKCCSRSYLSYTLFHSTPRDQNFNLSKSHQRNIWETTDNFTILGKRVASSALIKSKAQTDSQPFRFIIHPKTHRFIEGTFPREILRRILKILWLRRLKSWLVVRRPRPNVSQIHKIS